MQVNEQAVQAGHDGLPPSRQLYIDHNDVREILTAAAPYMSALEPPSARDQALEEAARIAELHEGEPCGPAIAWTEEQRQFYASGQHDASSSIAAAIRALKSQPAQTGWLPIKEEPDNTKGPFLVTNNPKALNAFDRPSHVWCVSGIYTDDDGSFCAFEGNQKIHGLTMFMPVVAPQTGGEDE